MNDVTSISKGVFVFPNGCKNIRNRKKSKKNGILHGKSMWHNEIWYHTYNKIWENIDVKLQELNGRMFSKLLQDIITYVKQTTSMTIIEAIPTAAVLTGINLPDHATLFNNLKKQIQIELTPLVAILHSDMCSSLKSIIENMVFQIIKINLIQSSDSESEKEMTIKKSSCTFAALAAWYEAEISWKIHNSPKKKMKVTRSRKSIVIIFPDFECISPTILQDFILIASSYLDKLPFVMVFGVATSMGVIHKSLPFKASSKLLLKVFQSEQSVVYLNAILDNIFLTDGVGFYLTGKPFKLLTDVFLFYDFSVNGFIEGIKFAFLEHCFGNNSSALAYALQSGNDKSSHINKILENFTHEDYESIRRLMSFRPYLEAQRKENIIKLFENDNYLKDCLKVKLKHLNSYVTNFFLILKCLHSLMATLPKHPLGKQLREFYASVVSSPITANPEFKECIQLLNFVSKEELLSHIDKISQILLNSGSEQEKSIKFDVIQQLKLYSIKIERSSYQKIGNDTDSPTVFNSKLSRTELKMKLLNLSKQQKQLTEFDQVRNDFLKYFVDICDKYLMPPSTQTFYEILYFDDILTLKTHIVGSPRAAIHTALNNPNYYLQCKCCDYENLNTILPTMPDISIVYKLHLECGKLINLYDWLQAYLTILDPEGYSKEQQRVLPELQARFTRAVAELQFLGFIKSSKRKTDHVQRLTWGGS